MSPSQSLSLSHQTQPTPPRDCSFPPREVAVAAGLEAEAAVAVTTLEIPMILLLGLGAFLSGWRSRVAADPQFPFKVLMEELVGVSACVLGDVATRPNFGLNELDFVFSTLVVGCILNFTLMYLLAPTLALSSFTVPGVFATCPKSHMFEPGSYGLVDRFGTLVYKGAVFAAVGFAAGLVGTAISNGLIMMRKKMDPNFETPNKPPPTLLNAFTWAAHMGVSSNLRYQTLNGIEFMLEKGLPPLAFKSSVLGDDLCHIGKVHGVTERWGTERGQFSAQGTRFSAKSVGIIKVVGCFCCRGE